MHTLGITHPDAKWYMDTGATSYMTYAQGRPVMRCESRGELYPITTPTTSPSTFAALTPSL
ncbi:hypothetical protein KY290_024318 [Solanum tuberosum]|uniref:Uncharacterized protein n=1 Tax=Solanum tuberosum TaxID=4113 RepID=A0ABQ7URK7_SOLTU|nr:hypothetical protein KY290_024318 [Solanum tuberosum]